PTAATCTRSPAARTRSSASTGRAVALPSEAYHRQKVSVLRGETCRLRRRVAARRIEVAEPRASRELVLALLEAHRLEQRRLEPAPRQPRVLARQGLRALRQWRPGEVPVVDVLAAHHVAARTADRQHR